MKKRLKLGDLPDPGSVRVPLENDAYGHGLCVVRRGGEVFAYLNRCPHTGGPMDWVEGHFLSADKDLIQCSTHGALFRIDDGHCLAGPCVGQCLMPVPVALDDDDIWLPEGLPSEFTSPYK